MRGIWSAVGIVCTFCVVLSAFFGGRSGDTSHAFSTSSTRTIIADPESLSVQFKDEEFCDRVIWLHNPTDFDIRIEKVTASCGCTVPEVPSDMISAHQSVPLNLRIKSPGYGDKQSFVRVEASNLLDITVPVNIRGKPLYPPYVKQWPRDRLESWVVNTELATTFTAKYRTVENRTEPPWIVGLSSTTAGVDISSPGTIGEHEISKTVVYREYEFPITVNWNEIETQQIGGQLRLSVTQDSMRKLPVAHFLVTRQAAIRAVPSTVAISQYDVGESVHRVIAFKSIAPRDWRITEVKASDSWLQARIRPTKEGDVHLLELTTIPTEILSTSLSAQITVATDHPGCPEISVPVHIR